jgi:uncharacterized protein YaaR (DUF327 family)
LKIVIIANPSLAKDYLVEVVGDDSGYYRLTVGKIEGDESSWQDFSGFINLGETDSFSFNLADFGKSIIDNPLQSIEELLLDLGENLLDQETLSKLVHWKELISADYIQALVYGYRLRNWLALQAKETSFDETVFLDSLDRVDSILVYLEKLVLENQGGQGEIGGEEYNQVLSFWEEERGDFSPLPASSDFLTKLAAFDFIKSNQYYSFLSEEPEYHDLVWAFSGLGLFRNSKLLLCN